MEREPVFVDRLALLTRAEPLFVHYRNLRPKGADSKDVGLSFLQGAGQTRQVSIGGLHELRFHFSRFPRGKTCFWSFWPLGASGGVYL